MTIFLIPSLFSLLHLKRYISLVKLMSGPQSFNCIEFDLFVFNFISCHLIFFLSNSILFVWFLFILLLFFSYWILFFDLIPNYLILIHCFLFNLIPHSYDCKSFYFQLSSWLFFFANSSLVVLFHWVFISYLVFAMLLKLDPGVNLRYVLGHWLGQMTKAIRINQIFYHAGS